MIIKTLKLILALFLMVLLLAACSGETNEPEETPAPGERVTEKTEDEKFNEKLKEPPGKNEEDEDAKEDESQKVLVPTYAPPQQDFEVVNAMTSSAMLRFESANAVSPEHERYLAFSPFVMVSNNESPRVLALNNSRSHAERLLSEWWGVEDREGALEQLEQLSTASGQSPLADDIYHTLVQNNYLEDVDGVLLYLTDYKPEGLENVYRNAERRAERLGDAELDRLIGVLGAEEEDREEVLKLLIYMQFADRINDGLSAYSGAKENLVGFLRYSEEDLMNLPTLAAWDYGRVAIIARYGVQAGYIEEDEAWEYFKTAADSASEIYSCWRQYTAAHILGRALAFGNNSNDFKGVLNYLLHHDSSPFQDIDFKE